MSDTKEDSTEDRTEFNAAEDRAEARDRAAAVLSLLQRCAHEVEEDRAEVRDRTAAVLSLLQRCAHELALLEQVPHLEAGTVNALSSARGFVERAGLSLALVSAPRSDR